MEARICATEIGIRVTNAEILVCEARISKARMDNSLKDVVVNIQVIHNQNQSHRNEKTNNTLIFTALNFIIANPIGNKLHY